MQRICPPTMWPTFDTLLFYKNDHVDSFWDNVFSFTFSANENLGQWLQKQ